MTKKSKRLNTYFLALVALSAVFVLLPEIKYSVFISEILIQFRVQVSFCLFLVFMILILKRSYLLGVIQMALMSLNIFPVVSLYSFGEGRAVSCQYDTTQTPLRVMSFNIYYKNRYYDSILQTLKIVDADIVLLQEAQYGFLGFGHDSLKKEYPFYYPETGKRERVSWALYSRYPIIETKIKIFPQFEQAALHAKIDVEGKVVDLIGLHAQSPTTPRRIAIRNDHIESLGLFVEEIARKNKRIIVAGDFNSVPWNPALQDFIRRTNLGYNMRISDFYGTWPAWGISLFSIPIDHIFHNEAFHNVTYQRSFPSGSDHYPIYADFNFCE